tara:strand:+ start:4674 stop:6134 length:1461 start_codon:yes stop_codon:yes gene_type:complete
MAISFGPNYQVVPAPAKQTLITNYIDFASGTGVDWSQQYLPDLLEKEAEVFGNRTISGFLEQVGAEESMTSDQVIWSEQGRLHLSYVGTMTNANGLSFTIVTDIDGNVPTVNGAVRDGDTVILSDANASYKCYVRTASAAALSVIELHPYTETQAAVFAALSQVAGAVTLMVFGSEHAKGTAGTGSGNAVSPNFQSFTNKPIIIKDIYEVSGSDASQIGWVEVSGEDGQNGFLWYLKAEGDTRTRFADYLEMTMLEAEPATAGNAAIAVNPTSAAGAGFIEGTEGLFYAVEDRGNITNGITGITGPGDLAEFDLMLAELDKNGAIEENMLFVNRGVSLAMDDMLASMNSYGAGGTSYGVFNNSEDMALNLGFSGFRRGSYDFYKSDFKYLNDKSTRGGIANTLTNIRGIMIPAGVSSVYDQQLGRNLKRPFLHVRYRASQMEDRKLKTWITGSVGATTSDLDAMQVQYLSERCLVVQGANNFFMIK